jgi:enoyl-CoA hydratase
VYSITTLNMETLKLNIQDHIAHVTINRPDKMNALNTTAWEEITEIFNYLDENSEVAKASIFVQG